MTLGRPGILVALIVVVATGCAAPRGDAIVACGQRFHTGTRVVLWSDPGGFNAYTGGSHFNQRATGVSMTLPLLQQQVDQFVLHYDACGSSRQCFNVLQQRGLSVHFMLDTDGTIYQTIDLKERAWHATTSNSRSIGIEIANIGAFPQSDLATLARLRMLHAVNTQLVHGIVQGEDLYQHDFTPQQYDALIKLAAALHKVLPRIELQYPRANGKLTDADLANFHGVLGHYHIQANKQDPGPAMQWDRVINGARAVLR